MVFINKTVTNQAAVILLEVLEKKQEENNCGRIYLFYFFTFRMKQNFLQNLGIKANFQNKIGLRGQVPKLVALYRLP